MFIINRSSARVADDISLDARKSISAERPQITPRNPSKLLPITGDFLCERKPSTAESNETSSNSIRDS